MMNIQQGISNIGICGRDNLISGPLIDFFSKQSNFILFYNIIEKNHEPSLRIIDWFVSNYCKRKRIVLYNLDIFSEYKSMLKSFSKKYFDPFRRGKRVFIYLFNTEIETTMAQLNFFRWIIEKNIFSYIEQNIQIINIDIKKNNKRSKININEEQDKQDKQDKQDEKEIKMQPIECKMSTKISFG